MSSHVVIAGAGLAGLSAALRLTEAGARVTLLETRKKLGGRATSFVDVRTGQTLDNCQHVALRCCTNYLDFLTRLGAADKLAWTSEQYWLEPGGRESVIKPGWAPTPAHFTFSVLRARFLTLGQKLSLARAMWAILRARRDQWRARTFSEFLTQHGQPAPLISAFWEPVVVSACNMSVSTVCAASALQVFQEGFLAGRHAADIGVASVPLVELYDRAEALIARAGGSVRLGCSVERIDGRDVSIVEGTRSETISADRVICALPAERAATVLDGPLSPRLADIEHSPILGVHLELDRPVMQRPHAVLVGAATQWLFRKDAEGRKLHAVISAANDWMPLDEPEIGRRVTADLRRYLPASTTAQVVRVRAVKEKRATFACTPAVEASRPAATAIAAHRQGPILAGDFTATGWPATMEGAVRSGYAAAALALGRPVSDLLIADQPVAPLARWLGLRPERSPLADLAPANSHPAAAAISLAPA